VYTQKVNEKKIIVMYGNDDWIYEAKRDMYRVRST